MPSKKQNQQGANMGVKEVIGIDIIETEAYKVVTWCWDIQRNCVGPKEL